MIRSFCLLGAVFLVCANINIYAQNTGTASAAASDGASGTTGEMDSLLRNRAVVMNIDARVIGEEKEVVWSETHRKTAIPGNPVGIKLVGSNVVVVVQFTPFLRRQGNVLVAQGQIWYTEPGKGANYYTSIQTIPLVFGEPVYFFPLGKSNQFNSLIEIIITVSRNTAENADASSKTEHD